MNRPKWASWSTATAAATPISETLQPLATTSPPPLRLARNAALKTVGLRKSYRKGNVEIPVLKGVDLEIEEGTFTAIIGQSGSGKSTLLHLLGLLDGPNSGEIWYDGERVDHWSARAQEKLRNTEFGMIFQFYHLLPELSTIEIVLVPRMIECGIFKYWRERRQYLKRAQELLERVGMGHRLNHKPNQLSGGEMQRTAIARALISQPKLLLADEPTGNLDRENGEIVMETLLRLCREEQLTIVMVTHDDEIATSADRVIRLSEGRVVA